jgi:hypothetical protein
VHLDLKQQGQDRGPERVVVKHFLRVLPYDSKDPLEHAVKQQNVRRKLLDPSRMQIFVFLFLLHFNSIHHLAHEGAQQVACAFFYLSLDLSFVDRSLFFEMGFFVSCFLLF